MLSRRELLKSALAGSSLLALSKFVPGFVYNTALAAEQNKDTILVVIEMNGGNDGLNMVIPYADDLYHKNRPTLRQTKEQVVKLDDHVGLNQSMQSLGQLQQQGHLAALQGIGYPNPDRSHFESMDRWHMADPNRKMATGWLGRSVNELQQKSGGIPMMHIGNGKLPLALQGSTSGAISVNNKQPYRLELGGGSEERLKARRKLLEDLAAPDKEADKENLLQFVARREVQTLSTLDRLTAVLRGNNQGDQPFYGPDGRILNNSLPPKLQLIARLILQDFGTRVFYVMIDGFDTHSAQDQAHRAVLQQVSDGITQMFQTLQQGGHDKRVLAMTFSEFGRRVKENGSKGTDHGAASCMLVAGPGVKGGVHGKHPSLDKLDDGDLIYHTDFRRVYATLLDNWLGVDSKAVLGEKFELMDFVAKKS